MTLENMEYQKHLEESQKAQRELTTEVWFIHSFIHPFIFLFIYSFIHWVFQYFSPFFWFACLFYFQLFYFFYMYMFVRMILRTLCLFTLYLLKKKWSFSILLHVHKAYHLSWTILVLLVAFSLKRQAWWVICPVWTGPGRDSRTPS